MNKYNNTSLDPFNIKSNDNKDNKIVRKPSYKIKV
jgi:hypothetical protein